MHAFFVNCAERVRIGRVVEGLSIIDPDTPPLPRSFSLAKGLSRTMVRLRWESEITSRANTSFGELAVVGVFPDTLGRFSRLTYISNIQWKVPHDHVHGTPACLCHNREPAITIARHPGPWTLVFYFPLTGMASRLTHLKLQPDSIHTVSRPIRPTSYSLNSRRSAPSGLSKVSQYITMLIEALPHVLIIHLKRVLLRRSHGWRSQD